ncbi:hypothetical protein PSACC_02096, partial [Paramicrosporidium saccamoebae]
EIEKALIVTAEQKLHIAKSSIDWGPDVTSVPKMSFKQIREKVSQGMQLVVIDDLVYDVSAFLDRHPGGANILKAYVGRDATSAFNGGLNSHTQSARTLARTMVVGRVAI